MIQGVNRPQRELDIAFGVNVVQRFPSHFANVLHIDVLINHHDPVHKVSIIPRGPALGVTWYLPKDDRHNLSKEQAESSKKVEATR